MPSKAHQLIQNMVVRKIREKGYLLVSYDGDSQQISSTQLKNTFKILRHRPDLVGVDDKNNRICIGEAKTKEDLYSARSKEQIEDYSNLVNESSGVSFEVVFGIPKSGIKQLEQIFLDLSIERNNRIEILQIPDELLPKNG